MRERCLTTMQAKASKTLVWMMQVYTKTALWILIV